MKPALKMPPLGRIFGRTKRGLAVYLTGKLFRMLELDESYKPTFKPVEILFQHETEEEKIKLISGVVDRLGLRGKDVVSCLTVDEGILKFQKFPASMPKKDLMEAINWYIKSETQQIKEETVYDYFFLKTEPNEKYVNVVITIARKGSVDKLVDTLIACDLKPKIVDYEIVSIINYGIHQKLPVPFSILYIDYTGSILAYYSKSAISYNKIDFDYLSYKDSRDSALLDAFLIESRNLLVINEISNVYLAGPIIGDEEGLENIMSNLPVLGILDMEGIRPEFFIPYTLSLRALEG